MAKKQASTLDADLAAIEQKWAKTLETAATRVAEARAELVAAEAERAEKEPALVAAYDEDPDQIDPLLDFRRRSEARIDRARRKATARESEQKTSEKRAAAAREEAIRSWYSIGRVGDQIDRAAEARVAELRDLIAIRAEDRRAEILGAPPLEPQFRAAISARVDAMLGPVRQWLDFEAKNEAFRAPLQGAERAAIDLAYRAAIEPRDPRTGKLADWLPPPTPILGEDIRRDLEGALARGFAGVPDFPTFRVAGLEPGEPLRPAIDRVFAASRDYHAATEAAVARRRAEAEAARAEALAALRAVPIKGAPKPPTVPRPENLEDWAAVLGEGRA